MKNDDKNSPENLVARTRRLAAFSKATGYNERMAAEKEERQVRRDGGQMRLFYPNRSVDRRHPEEY